MAKLNYLDCVARAFEPLVQAGNRVDLAPKLKALPPPSYEKADQFSKFSGMKDIGFPPLFLPSGGFFFPYNLKQNRCFAFSSFIESEQLNENLGGWLLENEFSLDRIDQAEFLFLSYHSNGYFALRPEYQSKFGANEILGVADYPDYLGHDLEQIIGCFRPTFVVSVPFDHILSSIDPYVMASEILSLVPGLRSPLIDEYFANIIHNILEIPSVSAQSVFLCLTAARWRYVYLELFRILESTLHVPWMLDLSASLPTGRKISDIYVSVRGSLEWREAKGRSLERVFAVVDTNDFELIRSEANCISLSGLDAEKKYKNGTCSERIYKIRNQLVHPQDFTDGSKISISEIEFRNLSIYLCNVIRLVYREYDGYLR